MFPDQINKKLPYKGNPLGFAAENHSTNYRICPIRCCEAPTNELGPNYEKGPSELFSKRVCQMARDCG
jgi:hypothetical protein